MQNITVLKNVNLPNAKICDLLIEEGRISHIGSILPTTLSQAETILDCSKYLCIPSSIDMHVHMRGGNKQSDKESWKTGSMAAVAGGVGIVVDQPNTIPAITNSSSVTARVEEAKAESYCNFAINGGVAPDCDFKDMYEAGAMAFGETFYAESSYGSPVTSDFLKSAFLDIGKLGALITIHAEDIAAGEDNNLFAHDRLRSEEGEAKAVRDILQLLKETGMKNDNSSKNGFNKVHFCHLSSPQSINAVLNARAMRADIARGDSGDRGDNSEQITFEVMPHHLLLSLDMLDKDDKTAKVNPPVRSEKTRKELMAMWDKIDVIASDSAPHTYAEKHNNDFLSAPSGIPGCETMIPLLMQKVAEKKITLDSLLDKTVFNPAKILGLNGITRENYGFVKGGMANISLYPKDLKGASRAVSADLLHSKAGFTPYEGMKAVFPEVVLINGKVTYDNGEFFTGNAEWIFGKGYIER